MSFKAAILMEDHLNDQYILKPLIESMLASIGKPNSKVTVVTSPRIQGIDQLKRNLCGIVNTFAAKVDLMVIAFDQDGQDGANGGKSRNTQVEDWLSQCANSKVQLLCAIQEVEVWCLWVIERIWVFLGALSDQSAIQRSDFSIASPLAKTA